MLLSQAKARKQRHFHRKTTRLFAVPTTSAWRVPCCKTRPRTSSVRYFSYWALARASIDKICAGKSSVGCGSRRALDGPTLRDVPSCPKAHFAAKVSHANYVYTVCQNKYTQAKPRHILELRLPTLQRSSNIHLSLDDT
eukprot:1193638-Prorocentrum_minimum.AAC.3